MTIKRGGDVFTAPLDDALLMMNVSTGTYYGLNGVAARIWELLEQPTTEAALIEQLLAEYDVDASACAEQVTAFLARLRERGLLVEMS